MSFERFVAEPGVALQYMAENDLLSACKPMPADTFVRFCTDRGLSIDAKRLESLERLGIFYPLIRVRYPKIHVKIERISENEARNHGMLRDGERWDGELREENSHLSWRAKRITSWIEEGFAWDPRSRPFTPWKTFRGDVPEPQLESFYSIFQCYSLRNVLTGLTCHVSLEQFGEPAGDEYHESSDPYRVGKQLESVGRQTIAALREYRRGEDAALAAQMISPRYYFHTQGDQRTITVPSPGINGWDWWEFSRSWNAKRVSDELELTPKLVKGMHRDVQFITSSDDPLENWYELVSFAALPKKQKLKGDALFAQLGYSIEHMLRLFYRDLTNEALLLPDEGRGWRRPDKYGEGVTDNRLRHLEFLVNEYNLNPRPKAILLVEGEGEAAEIPRLAAHVFGSDFSTSAIEVRPLGSIDEFTGDKRVDAYGALEKLVDDYHARQTIVFIVLDNENRAKTVREKLLKARSRIVPKRMLTKPEYVRMWDRTFEFDNFSDSELATAMSKLSDGRYQFTTEEVAECRVKWDARKRDHLSELYAEKLHYGLNKKALVASLIDAVIADRQNEVPKDQEPKRPIVALVKELVRLAVLNHQPDSEDLWLENQQSGYLGEFAGEQVAPPRRD